MQLFENIPPFRALFSKDVIKPYISVSKESDDGITLEHNNGYQMNQAAIRNPRRMARK